MTKKAAKKVVIPGDPSAGGTGSKDLSKTSAPDRSHPDQFFGARSRRDISSATPSLLVPVSVDMATASAQALGHGCAPAELFHAFLERELDPVPPGPPVLLVGDGDLLRPANSDGGDQSLPEFLDRL